MPWGVDRPWGTHPDQRIPDCIAELLIPGDRDRVSRGQAGMPCPFCGRFLTFPEGFRKGAALYEGDDQVYWARAIWDSYSDARKDYLRGNVPNVEAWLRCALFSRRLKPPSSDVSATKWLRTSSAPGRSSIAAVTAVA